MDRSERFYRIDQLLHDRTLVPFRDLLAELGVSAATLKRDLEYMRSRLHAPIEWDRDAGGYRLGAQGRHGPRYELPGLWFNASEVHALLTMQHLLSGIEPGLLGPHVRPLQSRLNALLESTDHSSREIARRIRILHMASRKGSLQHFEVVATAVLRRKRLHLDYLTRSRNEATERDVSPQRLVHYRDNWYLDAWCHLRKGIRSFAVDAIRKAVLLDAAAKDVSDAELDRVLGSGYGIFSGEKTAVASLKFTARRALWVALESWHPQQKSRVEKDGSYVLEFPYSDDRELVGDILRHGTEVEVVGPASLRRRVLEELRAAADRYDGKPV